jgi:hypothetical protein
MPTKTYQSLRNCRRVEDVNLKRQIDLYVFVFTERLSGKQGPIEGERIWEGRGEGKENGALTPQ